MVKRVEDMANLRNWERSEWRLQDPRDASKDIKRTEYSIDLGQDIGVYRLMPLAEWGYKVMLNMYTPKRGSYWATQHEQVNTAQQGAKLAQESARRIRA